MLFFALVFWFFFGRDYASWGEIPASMQNNRIFLFRVLHLPVGSHYVLLAIELIWKTALLTSAIGLFTRTSMVTAALSGIYILGVPNNFGKTGHGEGIIIFTTFILAFSRAGDAWSIDSLIAAWRSRDPDRANAKPQSGEYTWPIRLVWMLMSLIMMGAGVTKLRWSGLDWVTTDNLSTTILQHYYAGYSEPPTDLGIWIAEHRTLCKVIAGLTILIELTFPLAMFSRIARWTLVPAMFFAQVGIYLMMGVNFTQFMFAYLFWIPWDKIGARFCGVAQQRGIARPRYVMLYDGGCGICRSVASVVTRLDLRNRIEPIDVLHDWERVHERFPFLDQQKCLVDMHVIKPDGEPASRYIAYRNLAWAMPATWVALPFLYLPGVPQVGDRVYQYVATHRHDSGCEIPVNK
jgi:predicted DCC family thiol-disulfide oxidoreductase YuxK